MVRERVKKLFIFFATTGALAALTYAGMAPKRWG